MKLLKILAGLLVLMLLIFAFGPRRDFPEIDPTLPSLVDVPMHQLSSLAEKKDRRIPDLRPGNGSQLIWYDSLRQTPYALLYLHGFSASPMEGHPLHQTMAKKYGMNFYAPLLAGHGSSTKESFLNISPQDWIADASEALALAQKIGEKVIVMSCSTGSTLSVFLASQYPELIAGHIMYSPNFDLADESSKLLNMPWGLQLARMAIGGNYRSFTLSPEATPYWTCTYRIEGLQALRNLLDETMIVENWKNFDDPYLIAYYYESPELHDNIISVTAIDQFHQVNSTLPEQKILTPLSEPKSHVIASPWQSKNVEVVEEVTTDFLEQKMGLQPAEAIDN